MKKLYLCMLASLLFLGKALFGMETQDELFNKFVQTVVSMRIEQAVLAQDQNTRLPDVDCPNTDGQAVLAQDQNTQSPFYCPETPLTLSVEELYYPKTTLTLDGQELFEMEDSENASFELGFQDTSSMKLYSEFDSNGYLNVYVSEEELQKEESDKTLEKNKPVCSISKKKKNGRKVSSRKNKPTKANNYNNPRRKINNIPPRVHTPTVLFPYVGKRRNIEF